jgi:type IV secretory pathway VirB2 component (pilin)
MENRSCVSGRILGYYAIVIIILVSITTIEGNSNTGWMFLFITAFIIMLSSIPVITLALYGVSGQ